MIYVLYHADKDGFGAAYAAWTQLGNTDVEYIPVQYGNPPPKMEKKSEVYILDFSYSIDIMLDMQLRHRRLTIIDHHKTAQTMCEDGRLNNTVFDVEKSGCQLAWEYFNPNDKIPQWLDMIGEHDLWRFDKYETTDEVCMAIDSYPRSFEIWNKFNIDDLALEGNALVRFRTQCVEKMVKNPSWMMVGNYRVPAVNTRLFTSEVGHELCNVYRNAKFSACYFDISEDGVEKTCWSLRSVGDFDVSAVAKQQGGGGHKNAAGFVENH